MSQTPHTGRPRFHEHSAVPMPPGGALSPWVQLRSATRHPFIYRRMIAASDRAARPGDVVQVYDRSGTLFGRGLFNPKSEIVVRMLAWGGTPVDDAFWIERLSRAAALRHLLRLAEVTDAYRLVHGEGDDLSGVVVERYADCLVAEVFSLGMHQRAAGLLQQLAAILGPPSRLDRPQHCAAAWQCIVRSDQRSAQLEGFRPETPPPLATIIHEHGVRYRVDLSGGHKTGFFCDQRDNRQRFAALCRDAVVLDCCCYTGGFGLSARVAGGAREVTAVDLDEAAIDIARENANLNQVRLQCVHADAFAYLRQMIANSRTFDAVVLDPPKLAASRREVDDALRKYNDLNTLACQVVRPGGVLLTCSCSGSIDAGAFLDTVYAAGRRAERRLQRFATSGAAPDHPVADNCPESAYLKAVWFRVL